MSKLRPILEEHDRATRQIELAEVAIHVLESMHSCHAATRSIALLKAEQQRALKRIDATAAKLGAPYPTVTR